MLPEIVDKFQTNLDLFGEALVERIIELLPDLTPEEQEVTPILMSDSAFATCLVCINRGMTIGQYEVYGGEGCYFKCDVSLSNNNLSFTVGDFIGISSTWVDYWNNRQLILDNKDHYNWHIVHDGDIYARIWDTGFDFRLYYEGAYHDDDIRLYWNIPNTDLPDCRSYDIPSPSIITGNAGVTNYTVDADEILSYTPSSLNLTPNSSNNILYGIKGHPFICNSSDITYINDYVTNNDATNNYSTTYTTPDNKTITVYYGDNYIITHVNNNDPVSYDDMKNALNIAVNQINDDNDTDMTVPDYPVPPPPAPIESDNQEDGGNYNHAEFTKVYACTSAELNNLYQWMGGGAAGSSGDSPVTVPDNFDPMNRIVGLIGYPMIIDAGVGDQTTFTFRNAANQTINTGWSTYKYANFDRAFDFGTVTIPNWEELENGAPFLDYAATVEIYIPFCGIVGLDPQAVMGCTLSCKMWIDFVTGDCSAVVYTNYGGEDAQHPVAFVSGNCGSAEVVSANAFGAYQGAKAQASHKMSQAILGGFKDLATSVIGGATTGFTRGAANPTGTGGNAGMRAGAIGSVIGGAMNLGVNLTLQNMDNRYAVQVAKNALGTTISGSFGQQTSWYYMDTPYIKVTWPTPISKDVELYGKTFGVPVHRSGALSEFTGYTVCNNVDVSGIAGATASELAIIKQFLETGVFIKEGGEE